MAWEGPVPGGRKLEPNPVPALSALVALGSAGVLRQDGHMALVQDSLLLPGLSLTVGVPSPAVVV